jgi:glycosyltransferase involved in cell wall biosynthesis
MWRGARVAVVVPAYREARLIARTLARVPGFVDDIFVVDDASPDDTARVAENAVDARVTVLSHAQNRGVGAAIATGYAAALDAGAQVLVVMAADDQMHPGDLPDLLDAIVCGGADYAKGNRFAHPRARDMPWERRCAGRVLSALTRLATGLDVDDTQCGYTALSASTARHLALQELWPRYGYPNDLLGLLAEQRAHVRDVPVRPVYADEESGVRPWHALSVSAVIARRWWKSRSLRRRPRAPRWSRPSAARARD